MYFSTRQYPEFRGLSPREQRETVLAAIQTFDSRQGTRFLLGLGIGCLLGLAVGHFMDPIFPAAYAAVAGGLTTGVTFASYLFWEINGNTRAAVLRYLAQPRE